MPKKITLKPAMDDTEHIIYVDYPVLKEKAMNFFMFHNQLGSTVDAEVKFYDLTDKSGPPLSGICNEMSGETVLPIAKNGNTKCTLAADAKPGFYAYTISSPGFKTLDPVLIIESGAQLSATAGNPMSALLVLGAAAIAAVTGAVAGRIAARRHRAKEH